MTQTDRRPRATYIAADRPAKLPPMMMTSCRMFFLHVVWIVAPGETAANGAAQTSQRDLIEALQQQRFGLPERVIECVVHGLLDRTAGPFRAVADGQQRR